MLFKLRLQILILVIGGGLFYSGPNLADNAPLPSEHGFMLVRVILEPPARVGLLSMTNLDTNSLVTIRSSSFKRVGINAWITLVAMPNGHYYLSEFQSKYGSGGLRMRTSARALTQGAPESASETIEIVSGVVNYVGDWKMRISSLASPRAMETSRTIEFGRSTLEKYFAKYPEYANKYEIYISEVGEKAISLNELANAKAKNEQAERN
jgi:hypothetical protein